MEEFMKRMKMNFCALMVLCAAATSVNAMAENLLRKADVHVMEPSGEVLFDASKGQCGTDAILGGSQDFNPGDDDQVPGGVRRATWLINLMIPEAKAAGSSKIIQEIKTWLLEPRESARRGSHLLKAIEYPLKYWNGLTLFLADTRVPLTNNEAERKIRHAVMGRKNFYGSRTHNGADTAATLYTIIESCKKVELDPRTYIEMAVTLSAQKKTLIRVAI
jgi:hypothetical protein